MKLEGNQQLGGPMKEWIVVANKASCDVYEQVQGEYRAKRALKNPQAKMKGVDLFSDRSGRAQNSHGNSRVGFEESHYLDDLEKRFAKKITSYLDKQRHLGSFDQLTVVSGPDFMGLLREAASKELLTKVGQEIVKNVHVSSARQLDGVLGRVANE